MQGNGINSLTTLDASRAQCLAYDGHVRCMSLHQKKLMTDPKVCSYHDVLLRQSDVELLEEGEWLNDMIIAFYFEYLRHEKYKQMQERLLLMDPSSSFLLVHCCPMEAGLLLEPLQAQVKDVVLMPVNNNRAVESVGGSHWSLLCYERSSDSFYHFDSASNFNYQAAISLASRSISLLGARTWCKLNLQQKKKKKKNKFYWGDEI
eukprot:TRINITY_DN6879_c0_g1_i1.p1 TRINITY_DN6879_c0_g1~~TRINITY_DN6879_c0_g1_i1.p1  ORF type:complete len:205 (-),score=14.99 TRINITY_DN6879_c0_g1_i1:99-713(-)